MNQWMWVGRWWYHGLKAGVKLNEKGRLGAHGEHSLLDHDALDVVVLHDHVLLEHFYCIQLVGVLALGEHDLAERALAEYHEEVEVGGLHRVHLGGPLAALRGLAARARRPVVVQRL